MQSPRAVTSGAVALSQTIGTPRCWQSGPALSDWPDVPLEITATTPAWAINLRATVADSPGADRMSSPKSSNRWPRSPPDALS